MKGISLFAATWNSKSLARVSETPGSVRVPGWGAAAAGSPSRWGGTEPSRSCPGSNPANQPRYLLPCQVPRRRQSRLRGDQQALRPPSLPPLPSPRPGGCPPPRERRVPAGDGAARPAASPRRSLRPRPPRKFPDVSADPARCRGSPGPGRAAAAAPGLPLPPAGTARAGEHSGEETGRAGGSWESEERELVTLRSSRKHLLKKRHLHTHVHWCWLKLQWILWNVAKFCAFYRRSTLHWLLENVCGMHSPLKRALETPERCNPIYFYDSHATCKLETAFSVERQGNSCLPYFFFIPGGLLPWYCQ